MKSNLQDACLELGICVIDKSEQGNFIVYGLPSVAICDFVHDAMELAFKAEFSHQEIVITKRARGKKNGSES